MLLSPGDVMDPIWEDYADGGRDEQCVSRGKMWILLTNYGKNDEELGFTIISSLLQRRFGQTPNCSMVNAQPCACISSSDSKFLLKAAWNKRKKKWVWNNGMEGGAWKMPFCARIINSRSSLSCLPWVIVLKWESQLRWKNLTVLLSYSTSMTYQLQ